MQRCRAANFASPTGKQSARRPSHVAAGENMKMQMRHALSRLLADVGHDAVTLNALLLGELGNDLEDVRDDGAVLFVHARDRCDVRLRDHKKVHRRLRRDVVEGIAEVVLVDLVRRDVARDDLAEQTIRRVLSLLSVK